ncbi:hypothetical protein SteCoe_29338 [Stentor coeruleus]|uniref:UEV domain-containing protein n=1 Tax=Stentor coeruleus TaxID=5963 RepID=A0A1R2B668_9CILI|nr:hypothetical protein SteCoe_29338 [Stentor coeruleus]
MEGEVEKWILHSNYKVDLRPRIKVDLLANLRNFPTLRLNLLTMNDQGEVYKVIVLEGCLPIIYMNCSYNVPISCAIPPRYPYQAPSIYIKNPKNTSIQPSPYVDPDGQVKHPSIAYWDSKKSSLGNLLRDIIQAFGQHFPIASSPVPQPMPIRTNYPDLFSNVPERKGNLRIEPSNPLHRPYFEIEAHERVIEGNIDRACAQVSHVIEDPTKLFIELKQNYYDLFLLNRKKEKFILILSKLG